MQGYYVRADHHWHNHGIHKDWIICGAAANGGWFALHNKYAVKSETVGQFTGVTDKNGKNVFEHDIVRFDRGTFVVAFMESRMGFCFRGIHGRGCVPGFTMSHWEQLELIGNTHDNPELLEV